MLAAGVVLLTGAVACLAWALVIGDFRLVYVAEASSRASSTPYRLAGLWGGMAGSLLFWTWLLAFVSVVAARSVRRSRPDLSALVGGVLAALVGAFLAVGLAWADPFDRLAVPAIDGAGLAPILEHPAMLYHPPLLYLGLVTCAVPFALAVAGLVRPSVGVDLVWLSLIRQWAGVAWLVLTVGMLAGAHWAYVELGWGGFWAWDPVENAALLPWLGVTALVHAAMVDEHRSHVRPSTVALALGSFVAALVGTLLTRSGAVSSVHAFAEAVAVGRALLALVVVVVVGSAVLLWRRRSLTGPRLSRQPSSSPPGRSHVLALNAVVVLGVAVVVAWGTLFPLVAELAGRRPFAVSGRFFALLVAPLALAALGLVGLAPVLRWRGGVTPGGRRTLPWAGGLAAVALVVAVVAGLRAPFAVAAVPLATFSAVLLGIELVRRVRAPGPPRARHRAAGAVVAHLGVVVFLAGVAGSTTGQTASVVLAPGEQTVVAGYGLRHNGAAVGPAPSSTPSSPTSGSRNGATSTPFGDQNDGGVRVITLDLALSRGEDLVATLRPEQGVYEDRGLVLAETALRSTPFDDVLVAIRTVGADGTAVVEVSVRPLAVWVWWGWILVAAGGVTALVSGRRRGPTSKPNAQREATTGASPTVAVRLSGSTARSTPELLDG